MIDDVAQKIWELPKFRDAYLKCVQDFSIRTLGFAEEKEATGFDWSYLLEAASLFSQTENPEVLEAALRISSMCLHDDMASLPDKISAGYIFGELQNVAGKDLAIRRGYLSDDILKQAPNPLKIDMARQTLSSEVVTASGQTYSLNKFQKDLWKELSDSSVVSASSPTASGKSFAVLLWIAEILASEENVELIYIAPTRALVSEVERNINRLISEQGIDAVVSSVPWGIREALPDKTKNVFVLTQERYHLLLNRSDQAISPDYLIVDEAHKVDDGVRGMLLDNVVDQTIRINPSAQVCFISPSTTNPEELISGLGTSKTGIVYGKTPTVNQNIFWVNQKNNRLKEWEITQVFESELIKLTDFSLENSPNTQKKRLAFNAARLGKSSSGNIVYVNGAADAEDVADLICQLLDDNEVIDPRISELDTLIKEAVHPEFLLRNTIKKGVAFHYGNLPEIIRESIERLFSEGVIQFLVCTSTLVEGVNLACKNIFLRGPQRGRNRLMTHEDFWNLSGRAGRWGKEFAGNIYCIDANIPTLWKNGEAPRSKARIRIKRQSIKSLSDVANLTFGEITDRGLLDGELNASISLLLRQKYEYGRIEDSPLGVRLGSERSETLDKITTEIAEQFPVDQDIVHKNPHVSPVGIFKLEEYLNSRADRFDSLLPSDPSDPNAVEQFSKIFYRCAQQLGAFDLGRNVPLSIRRAIVVVRWMNGWQVPRIIEARLNVHRQNIWAI